MGKLNNKDRKKPTANTVKKIVTNGVKKPLVIGLPFQQQKSDVANTKDTQIVTAYNNKKKDSSSGISNKLVSNSHNHNSQKNTKNNFKKVEKDSSTGKTAIKKEVISTKKDKKTKVDSTTIDSTVDEIDTINKRRWWELPIDDSCLPVLEDLEDKPWYTLLPPFINKFHTNNTNNNTNNSNNSGNSSANKKFLLPKEDDCPHIKAYLESLYKKEVLAYYKYNKNNINSTSNNKFMKELINAGTISDRIAALTLKVQESPLHNLESLELLILMTTKKEIRVTQLAIEAIKDLLINNILPTTRKLYSLSEQPLLSNGITISANTSSDTNNSNSTENRSNTNSYRTLLLLYYENEVKKLLVTLVAGLENGLKSNIEYHKKFIINMITELLISIPEQEQKLLYLLINKFSDPSNTIISKVIESLKYIISKHNNMKNVIIYETKQFIYRSNNKLKSIYNTIIFFNQIKFDYHNSYDHLNALALIECYLSLFEKAISEKENGSRLLSGLLSGINKAFPYLTQIDTLHKYINSIFRIIHTTNFTTATQALMVLSHIAIPADSKSNSNSDGTNKIIVTEESKSITTRYYRALYATLFSDQVKKIQKQIILI